MKERLPEVIKAKSAGTIGEGVDGFLHVRADDASADLKKMVAEENKDRMALFESLAEKTKGSKAEAAKIFAKAMVGKGKKGHWFKSSKGTWKQKLAKASRWLVLWLLTLCSCRQPEYPRADVPSQRGFALEGVTHQALHAEKSDLESQRKLLEMEVKWLS